MCIDFLSYASHSDLSAGLDFSRFFKSFITSEKYL